MRRKIRETQVLQSSAEGGRSRHKCTGLEEMGWSNPVVICSPPLLIVVMIRCGDTVSNYHFRSHTADFRNVSASRSVGQGIPSSSGIAFSGCTGRDGYHDQSLKNCSGHWKSFFEGVSKAVGTMNLSSQTHRHLSRSAICLDLSHRSIRMDRQLADNRRVRSGNVGSSVQQVGRTRQNWHESI